MRLSKRSLVLLSLIAIMSIAGVSAVAYVTLEWQVNTTITANPKVSFVLYPSTKANTFSYSVSVFPNIKTIDENITYGVWNWDTVAHACYMRMASENTTETDINWVYIKVWNATGNILTHNYTDMGTTDTTWYSMSPYQGIKYAIWIEIGCPNGATVGNTPRFTFEMKVENP